MRRFYAFLVCVILIGCASNLEPPVVAATSTKDVTSTPQPDFTATQKAIQAATQTMVADKHIAKLTERAVPTITAKANAASTLDEIKIAASKIEGIEFDKAVLYLGALNDTISDLPDGFVAIHNSNLSIANFIVSISFINPRDTATEGKWDYGLLFRDQGKNKQYRLVILSNQSWTLYKRDADTVTYIYSSNNKNLKAKVGDTNTIWLIVIGKEAHLFLNGGFVKSMDLGNGPARGNILPAIGIYYGNEVETVPVTFQDFAVWKLP